MAAAVHWGKRGARINTISPGIIMTPAMRSAGIPAGKAVIKR
jgi:NAD(P)-dependent dehydrogenase (short-subunit alcohol dehydrogenase family)